ncbi:MAG: hypothetical protein JXB30_20335 [Anaerolineae bacterium]|nr:hypothetical protein [Anaerolineae bacterium]
MTTKCICTRDTICTEQFYRQPRANQNNEESIWTGLTRLTGTIGYYATEIYHNSNDPEPVFSNGGTRVLIRPGRIDLV